MRMPFDATMDIYGSADNFTVAVATGVACRLTQPRSGPSVALRAEEAQLRTLLYDPSYSGMPAHAQVEIAGSRWNLVVGSEAAPAAFGTVHHRRAVVQRAD